MIKDILTEDLKKAMLDRDMVAKGAVQMIKAAILLFEKDNQKNATDEDIIGIVAKELKKRRDSLSEYEKSGRQELIDDLNKEIAILLKYLPEQLSESEITEIVDTAIKESGATSIKEMGKVMGLVTPKVKGRADNKVVSELIKARLA